MSDTRAEVVHWPNVAALRGELAERVIRVAEMRQAETGWTDDETVLQVAAAANDAVNGICSSLIQAAAMTLDVWVATR